MAEVANYLLKYHPGDITFRALLDDRFFDEEGLFYARKEFDYSIIDGIFERKRLDLQNSSLSAEIKEQEFAVLCEWEARIKTGRDVFINNKEEYEEGMNLLKKHYFENIKKLKGYGLFINVNFL